MIVKQLSLQYFKNHQSAVLDFSPQINCFVGNNGSGKTNILDALHYLSVGKSFLPNPDIHNIYSANNVSEIVDFFSINATIFNNEKEDYLKIIQTKEPKKIIRKNEKNYTKFSQHIGYLPSVMISPYDANLISDSGESRRKFLDMMISQTDPSYLFDLLHYQKAVGQRNALLKFFTKNRTFDQHSLEIYDQPISQFGTTIFEKRRQFVWELNPIVQQFYNHISGGYEQVEVSYQSHLLTEENILSETPNIPEKFRMILQENLERDRQLTYTSKGIHKDDLLFVMNKQLLKKIGSQGQQKSFLVALKLAQINRIKQLTGKNPILLLDDIFDKLDDQRVSQLVQLISQENFGQIFITDTHRERTEKMVKNITEDSKIFSLPLQ